MNLVIAGSRRQWVNWIRVTNRDRAKFIYVNSEFRVRWLTPSDVDFWCVGTYIDNPLYGSIIMQEFIARGATCTYANEEKRITSYGPEPRSKSKPKLDPVYLSLVCSHRIAEDKIPGPVLQKAKDSCEAGVRRVLRAWPDDSRLTTRVVQKDGQTFVGAFWA